MHRKRRGARKNAMRTVQRSLAVSLRAREAGRDGIGRALVRRRIIFRGCGAGAAGVRRFERSELGGLRRQQRIATTWTWVFSVRSLLAYARARRGATESAALWSGAASYFAVAVPARPECGGSSGAS